MSEAQAELDVPALLDMAAAEIGRKDRELELLRAQLSVLSFVDKVLTAGAGGYAKELNIPVSSVATLLAQRAKSIRRMEGK